MGQLLLSESHVHQWVRQGMGSMCKVCGKASLSRIPEGRYESQNDFFNRTQKNSHIIDAMMYRNFIRGEWPMEPQKPPEPSRAERLRDRMVQAHMDGLRGAFFNTKFKPGGQKCRHHSGEFVIDPDKFRTPPDRFRDVAHSEKDRPNCPTCGNSMWRKVLGAATISTTTWKCWHCPIDTAPEVEDVEAVVVKPKQLPENGAGL